MKATRLIFLIVVFIVISAMKARAKVKFYEVLTAGQRAIVIDQFRQRSNESPGSISN